jgi:O-antigen/teichoic acid export membrane protein
MDVFGSGKKMRMPLARLAISGAKWTSFSAIITAIIQFCQLLILARLLKPEDFGLMAMVMVVIGFAQTYADLGVSAAIIHRQDATRTELSSLYWLNIVSGICLFLLMWVITPLIVLLFREPRLKALAEVISLGFLITPIGVQFQVLLEKTLRFDILARQEIITSILGLLVTIFLAWLGYGVWALVWGQLSAATAKTVLLVRTGWQEWAPSLRFKFEDLYGYLSFGMYQMGERTINYLNSRFDQLLIGCLLGPQSLGYYSFACNLVMQPISRINPVLTKVAFPIFAKIQGDDNRLRVGYFSVQRVLSTVNFPILVGLSAVAPLFVPVVFGNQWHPAITLVQILAFVALIRATGNPVGSLLLAKGRADVGFRWNAILMIAQIPGIAAGAYFGGSVGVCIALLILQLCYLWLGYLLLIRRFLGPCLKAYVETIAPPFVLSIIMAIPVVLLPWILIGLSGHWTVVLQIVCGTLAYCTLTSLLQKELLTDMKRMILEH